MYDRERDDRGSIIGEPVKPVRINVKPGALIPAGSIYTKGEFPVLANHQSKGIKLLPSAVAVFLVASLVYSAQTFMPGIFGISQMAAAVEAPPVYVTSDNLSDPKELHYGSEPLLSHPSFFAQTKNSFITNQVSFIEADLSAMKVKYYDNGEVAFEAEILSKGKEGSWWETPAGLYKVENMKDNHFSSFGQVYTPWNMVFQGNFFIHGWPEYPDGTLVPTGYSGGCIRLDSTKAKELYELVQVGVPVLVFEHDFDNDGFEYEPKAPELTTDHYLVSDIRSNTILAGDNIHDQVPIASLTKLMTALVAAEYINLDTSVRISPERYVDTLVPRLEGRYKASMYSLLQLLLVESSNEAAEVIASVIGRDNFISKMNQKAESLGLTATVFADPSGLDNGNVSSAADLMRLMQYIHNNRSFVLELTKDADLDTAYVSGEFGELENFNDMDGVANFLGGKVGETMAAGKTSASLHTVEVNGEERIISIILLNSEERTDDVKALHRYVSERYGD